MASAHREEEQEMDWWPWKEGERVDRQQPQLACHGERWRLTKGAALGNGSRDEACLAVKPGKKPPHVATGPGRAQRGRAARRRFQGVAVY